MLQRMPPFALRLPPRSVRLMVDATNKGRWPPSRVFPVVAKHPPRPPPFGGRGLSHSSLSRRGVPPIHQACQRWHPFPVCARRLGTSWPDCIPDTHREQHTDTLMDSFIRPFITQGANGKSQCTECLSEVDAVAL